MPDELTEHKAEALARAAAERAAELALQSVAKASSLAANEAEKAQAIAVARAVKDANYDRDLRDHAAHLTQINGSQRSMAASLTEVKQSVGSLAESFERQATANAAVAKYVGEQSSGQFSRRTLWIGGLAAGATWLAILATLATTVF
jgi:hypothetical protein